MSTEKTNIIKGHSVIAISQEEDSYKAVCITQKGGITELAWSKSCAVDEMDWSAFIADCLQRSDNQSKKLVVRGRSIVVGFNSTGVVFYRLQVPAVKEEEIERIVKLQTETKLPLPAKQIDLAYRTGVIQNGQATVTVAAAKKENLQRFVENVSLVKPEKIILDCEGLVKTWWNLFSDGRSSRSAVVVNIGRRSTRLCLVEGGKLSNAAIVDMGTEDLIAKIGSSIDMSVTERFVQDVRGVLELFGFESAGEVAVYVFAKSAGDKSDIKGVSEFEIIEHIVSALGLAGLDAKVSDFRFPASNYHLSTDDNGSLYEYRVPIGVGLMALDSDKGLDLFSTLYRPAGMERKKHWLYSLKAASIVTGIMLVLIISTFYFLDVAQLNHLNELKARIDYGKLVGKQNLMKVAAERRADLLELLSEFSSIEANGVMLSRIDFKMGVPVKIKGTAPNAERLYKFQEDLLAKKDFREVRIQSAPLDEKTRKLNFTIAFLYKNFSEK